MCVGIWILHAPNMCYYNPLKCSDSTKGGKKSPPLLAKSRRKHLASYPSTFYSFFFFIISSTDLVNCWMSSAISRGSSMAAKWPPRCMGEKLTRLWYFCLTQSLGVCISSLGKQAKPVGTKTGILGTESNQIITTALQQSRELLYSLNIKSFHDFSDLIYLTGFSLHQFQGGTQWSVDNVRTG